MLKTAAPVSPLTAQDAAQLWRSILLNKEIKKEYPWLSERIRFHPSESEDDLTLKPQFVTVYPDLAKSSSAEVQNLNKDKMSGLVRSLLGDCPVKINVMSGEYPTFTISAKDLIKFIPQSPSAAMQEAYAWQQHQTQAEKSAHKKSEIHPEHSLLAQRWHKLLTADYKANGVYFPTGELAQIGNKNSRCYDALEKIDELPDTLNEIYKRPKYAAKLAKAIESMGFRRVAFFAGGGYSLVLAGVPNKEGRLQLITVSPSREKYIPCPLILPPIETKEVRLGNESVKIRVMPAIDVEGCTTADIEKVKSMADICHLWPQFDGQDRNELRKDNVGIYRYTDAEGKKHAVPMILDWGAVGISEEVEKLQRKWEKMPELQPWRDALAHIKQQKGTENVVGDRSLKKAISVLTKDGERESSLAEHLKRRYPSEMGAAVEKAAYKMNGDKTGKSFVKKLNKELDDDSDLYRR